MRERVRFGIPVSHDAQHAVLERDGIASTCIVRRAEEGKPTPPGADLVHVKESHNGEWHDAETLYHGSGPAQVATPAYREGYERIFGKKEVGIA